MTSFCKIILIFAVAVLFSACSSETPKSVNTLLIDASRDADIGNWREAQRKAGEAYSREPNNVNAAVMYAIALEYESLTTALDVLEKVAPNANKHFMAQFSYGRMLYSRGLNAGGADYFQRALEPLTKALTLEPNDIPTMIHLGKVNMKLGQYDRAFTYFYSITKDPNYKNKPEAHNEAGVAKALSYEQEASDRKLNHAKHFLSAAYNRGKNDPRIVFNAAVFYDKHLKDQKLATFLYKRYLTLTEDTFQARGRKEAVEARLDVLER